MHELSLHLYSASNHSTIRECLRDQSASGYKQVQGSGGLYDDATGPVVDRGGRQMEFAR